MNMISETKSYNIPIRSLLDSMDKGSILSYCTLMSFNHNHNKYITTINKEKEDSWNALIKAPSITRIPKERTKFALSSILHM